MRYYNIFAYNIGKEIDIRGVSEKLLGKKIRIPWEEPLIIKHNDKTVFIYSFGSIVLVNPYKGMFDEVFKKIEKYVIGPLDLSVERYRIIVLEDKEEFRKTLDEYGLSKEDYIKKNIIVTDDACFLYNVGLKRDIVKIVGYTLAQSLALERIEKDVENALERIRSILENFAKKSFLMRLKPAIKELVQVLEARFEALSDIMVLQKPELTWEDPLLDELYEELRKVYEIDDRFKAIDTMLENILETGQIISDLASTSREMVLESLILFLIAIELILALIEFIF